VIKLIILDPSLNIPFPEADFTVAEISQYFSAYTRIVGAIHTKSDLQVVVTDKQVGKWLNILQSRYGKEYV
jgi:hypothetical protein